MRRLRLALLLLLLGCRDASAVVADFRAVYTPLDGWGGRVPTVWEVIHSVGLGGRARLTVEGLYLHEPEDVDGAVFLTVVDHEKWHNWFQWISATMDTDPGAAWARSVLLCSAPAVLRVELHRGGRPGNNGTAGAAPPLDFSDGAAFEPDPKKRLVSSRVAYDFSAFGLYSVHLVTCRAADTGNLAQAYSAGKRDDYDGIPITTVSGRITLATEAPTMVPDLLVPTAYEQQATRRDDSSTTKTTTHVTRLHELAYGETPYPTVWLVILLVNMFLLSDWALTLSGACPRRHWRTLLRRGRIRDLTLPVLATLSLAAKVLEAVLKFAHYDRIRRGYPMLVSLPFFGSVLRTTSISVLILLLAIGSLGIGITRSQIYLREAVILAIGISTHFVMGLSQAFCPANQSPTAVELPTSSSSMSRRTNITIYQKFFPGMLGEVATSSSSSPDSGATSGSVTAWSINQAAASRGRALDEYYLSADACNVIVFNEYLLQALIILVIIVALNFNIAKMRQHLSSNRFDRESSKLYDKLYGMYMLRRSFLMFLLAPTILLVVQIMLLTWRYTWLMTLMVETVSVSIYWYLGKALFQQAGNPFAEQLPLVAGDGGVRAWRAGGADRTHRAATVPVTDLGGGGGNEEEMATAGGGGAGESKEDADTISDGDGNNPVLEIDLDW